MSGLYPTPEYYAKVKLAQKLSAPRRKRPHTDECKCGVCDKTPWTCAQCGKEGVGAIRRGQHEWQSHKARRRKRTRGLRVDGEGYLRRITADGENVNLGAITRFSDLVYTGAKIRRSRTMIARDKFTVKALEELDDPNTLVSIASTHVPAKLAVVIYRLAIMAGTSPRTVATALLYYGIEHLAQELRATRRAPAVRAPVFESRPGGSDGVRVGPAGVPAVTEDTNKTAGFFPQKDSRS